MKKLSRVRACKAVTRDTRCAAVCTTGENRHPARSGLPVKIKERARSRLTVRTRSSLLAHRPHMLYVPSMCWFQGIADDKLGDQSLSEYHRKTHRRPS
jgi:hypothetical protein